MPTVTLAFLIDGTKYTSEKAIEEVKAAIGKLSQKVEVSSRKLDDKRFELWLKGPFQDVDYAHIHLNKTVIRREEWVRIHDEAGNAVRNEAYPILGAIEQQLRRFIVTALTEAQGFSWWDAVAPERNRDRVDDIATRNAASAEHTHWIEFSEFGDILDIVTHSHQAWSDEAPLTAKDLDEILSAPSMDAARARLSEKRKSSSLWDDVFSRYFTNKDDWKALAKTLLADVVPFRNRVMHHRPAHAYELEKLKAAAKKVEELLQSAKLSLTAPERETVVKETAKIAEIVKNEGIDLAHVRRQIAGAHLDPGLIRALNAAQFNPEIAKLVANINRPLIDTALMAKFKMPDFSGPEFKLLRMMSDPKFTESIRKAMEPFQHMRLPPDIARHYGLHPAKASSKAAVPKPKKAPAEQAEKEGHDGSDDDKSDEKVS